MTGYCYDIETYKEIFTFTAINIEDRSEIHQWYIHESCNDLMKILKFINNDIYLIGYNNLNFDNVIMNFLTIRVQDFKSTDHIINCIWQLANKIIDSQDVYTDEEIKIYKYYKPKYKSLDLYRIAFESIERKGLKQTAINLKYPYIQDLPILPDATLNNTDIPIILDYNKNDVLITLTLFDYLKEKIAYRFAASNTYHINLLNCNKSQIADKILVKLYSELTNLPYDRFKDLRTHYKAIRVDACLDKNITFTSYELNNLYTRFANKTITDTHKELKESIKINGLTFNLGTGGLHSKDYPAIFKSDECTIIRDCDVTSFYPYIVINLKVKPNHLSEMFFTLSEFLVKERINAKDKGNTIVADTLKISINSGLFGKMGAEHSWAYDRKAMVTVTLNGQLYLLTLIEQLTAKGFNVISANTDGVVTIIPKDKEYIYNEITEAWQHKFKFALDYTDYNLYVRRDINNYFTVTTKNKVKEKGDFVTEIDIAKGYDKPIIPIALQNYFRHAIPILHTMLNHTNIYDFCMSVKTGDQFRFVYHTLDIENAKLVITKLQKHNRYYVSLNGGTLFKEDIHDLSLTGVCVGEKVTIYNNHIEKDMKDYYINYNYYRIVAQRIIDSIECGSINKKKIMQNKDQMKLF